MNKKNRYISGLLAVALGLSVTAGSFTSAAAAEQPVTQLVEAQVEHQTNPIGMEQNPTFSWKMQSKQIGASQQAYQIVIIYDYQELPMESAYSYNTSDIITADAGSNYAQGEIDFTKANSYQPGDEIHLKAGDTLIADFGQNASATVALQVSAPAGTKISMQPGECLSDGKDGSFTKGTLIPGACAGRGVRYIASGEGVESYRAQFPFTGYQYLDIRMPSCLRNPLCIILILLIS